MTSKGMSLIRKKAKEQSSMANATGQFRNISRTKTIKKKSSSIGRLHPFDGLSKFAISSDMK
jgi:hypothetical protein